MLYRFEAAVVRRPLRVLLVWAALAVGLYAVAPNWQDIALDGDLAHLPADAASLRGDALLREAFAGARSKSQLVLVVARRNGPLSPHDYKLADDLSAILIQQQIEHQRNPAEGLPIVDVWTKDTEFVGKMLRSPDQRAVLLLVQLDREFMAVENMAVLAEVERIVETLRPEFLPGVEVGITGSAAIGADMLQSAAESIARIDGVAILLVAVLLLVVYRSPLLVVVPLTTIYVSVFVATALIALLTQVDQIAGFSWWNFHVFKTTRIFLVVILYGAGTDYCLFLIARYKEEYAQGTSRREAIAAALFGVRGALIGSALTTVVGLGLMFFASYGKFSNSGPAIALALLVGLAASLTLTPALLALLGDAVFWPLAGKVRSPGGTTTQWFAPLWNKLAAVILTRPGLLLIVSLAAMAPLAYYGYSMQGQLTYDLLSELSPDRTSVRGTNLFRRHFYAGEIGPLTVLARRDDPFFATNAGQQEIARLTKQLYDLDGVAKVRSAAEPTGNRPGSFRLFRMDALLTMASQRSKLTRAHFISEDAEHAGRVARFDLTLNFSPFSAEAQGVLENVQATLEQTTANDPAWRGAAFEVAGVTPGIADLRAVTQHDRTLIQVLVTAGVFLVLWILLRRPGVCLYLILSVLWSYLVTLGATELFFAWYYGPTFHGLDWKVPIFLFVLLVAIGEDYNIYLTTRVFEEQRQHGLRTGLRRAVVRTGGIITSCGLIMAGTFCSMTTGTLRGVVELGFALSLGVLLDTLVVRSILVPAFLALLARDDEPTAKTES